MYAKMLHIRRLNTFYWSALRAPADHVQRMFRQTQGTQYISTTVAEVHTDPAQPETIAASATCQNTKCSEVVVKLVNFSPQHQSAVISLLDSTDRGVDAPATKVEVASTGELVVLTGSHPEVENSFDAPFQVAPFGTTMEGLSDSFVLPLAPWSVSMLMLQLRIETVVSEE
jgi:alpha-L-arabinofuranosidase